MSNNILLPTSYFPSIEYYAFLSKYKKCKIEKHENFIKQSIRNRCYIYGANGVLRLTIPKKKSNKKKIKDIEICYKSNWQKEHWNAIKSSYNSSPYFFHYKEKIKSILHEKEHSLFNLNNKITCEILNILTNKSKIQETKKYEKEGDFIDLRNYKFNKEIHKPYEQVFTEKHGFITNLSILDLLFNLGPRSIIYLNNISI